MTVAEMRERLSATEYIGWQVYYGRKAQREEMALGRAKGGSGGG